MDNKQHDLTKCRQSFNNIGVSSITIIPNTISVTRHGKGQFHMRVIYRSNLASQLFFIRQYTISD